MTILAATVQSPPPIVVELFTSEGCSDCPPADDLLNSMVEHRSAKLYVIPLAFHVTYWDRYGWRDRFSNPLYTARQRHYQSQFHIPAVYTPQSVIDGRYQTVGNDSRSVMATLQRAATDPKPVTVEVIPAGDSVTVTAHANTQASGEVLLAITEDGLTTDVKSGENRSRTLRHSAVVRSLDTLGKLREGSFSKTVHLRLRRDWQRDRLRVVVLVQNPDGQVLGAAMASLGPKLE